MFYRWKRRQDPKYIESLEDLPHRLEHLRQPGYSLEMVRAVHKLREEYPRWGKDKLVILLSRDGFASSVSTVNRILKKLKDRRILREPLPNHISASKSWRQRLYAIRKPKDYVVKEPGDIVEVHSHHHNFSQRILPHSLKYSPQQRLDKPQFLKYKL
jgi:putative transposase